MAKPLDPAARLAADGFIVRWRWLGHDVDRECLRCVRDRNGRFRWEVLVLDAEGGAPTWHTVGPGELIRTIREA